MGRWKKVDREDEFRHRDRVKFADRGSAAGIDRRVRNLETGVTPVPGAEGGGDSGGGDSGGGGDPGGGGSVRFFEADVTSTDPLEVLETGQSPVSAVNRSGKYLNPGYVVWCSFDSSTGETSVLSVLSAGSGGGDSTVFPPTPVPPKTFNGFPRSELVEGDINGEQKLLLSSGTSYARVGGQLKPTSVGPHASNLWMANYAYDANDMGTYMSMFSGVLGLGFLLENGQIYCAARGTRFSHSSSISSGTSPHFQYYQESDSTTYSVSFPDNTQSPSWVSSADWVSSDWASVIAVEPVSRRAFMLSYTQSTYYSATNKKGFILWELDLTSASSRQLGWQLVWDWNVEMQRSSSISYTSVNQNEGYAFDTRESASPGMLLFAHPPYINYRLPAVGVDLDGTPIIFSTAVTSPNPFQAAVIPKNEQESQGCRFNVTETGFKSQQFSGTYDNAGGVQTYNTSLWNVPDTTYTSAPPFSTSVSTNYVSGRAHRRGGYATFGSTVMPWGEGPTETDLPTGYSVEWSQPHFWETNNFDDVNYPLTEAGDMYGLRMVWLTSNDDGLRYPFLQYAFKNGNVAWVKMSGDPGGANGTTYYANKARWFIDFEGNTVAQADYPTWYELLVSPPV